MLRRLYNWVLSLSARPTAQIWLAVIAFVESSVFLIPADVMLLPMVLTRPQKAYRYAAIATLASVLGGVAGWALGYFAYEAVAKPVLAFYGKLAEFEHLKASIDDWWIFLMMITSGVAHLPPIKVVTILSGAVHMGLPLFVASATITRGARFFLLAYLLRRFGADVARFVEQRLTAVVLILVVLLTTGLLLSGRLTHG